MGCGGGGGLWARALGKLAGTEDLGTPPPTVSLNCAISFLVGRVQVLTGRWGLGFLKAPNLGICNLSLGEGCFLDPERLRPGWWEGTQASGRRRVARGCPSEDHLWHELYRPRLRWPGWSLRPDFPRPCALSLSQPGPPTHLLILPRAVLASLGPLGARCRGHSTHDHSPSLYSPATQRKLRQSELLRQACHPGSGTAPAEAASEQRPEEGLVSVCPQPGFRQGHDL